MSRKRIVVVCPGRGSYTKENLGYLDGRPEISEQLATIDELRKKLNQPTVSEMDNAKVFKTSLHTKGEHASPLIFTCSLADYLTIDPNKYEIVAIAGNSMGWYLSLAFADALSLESGFHLIQTMGGMMQEGLIGGQIIYPIVDEHWQIQPSLRQQVFAKIDDVKRGGFGEVHLSIELGGYLVIGGEQKALTQLMKELEPVDHFPFQLINHGAFHTPLLQEVSSKAFEQLSEKMFKKPRIPLIDGRGHIWQPYSTDIKKLYDYTLGHQVYKPYDFTSSISVALKEFAPDHLVLLGPGNSLGGALGQIIIKNQWLGLTSKQEFIDKQQMAPFLLSYGVQEQREILLGMQDSQGTEVSHS